MKKRRKRKQIERWSTNLKTVIGLNEKKNSLGEDWWFNIEMRKTKNRILIDPKMILESGLVTRMTIFRFTWN